MLLNCLPNVVISRVGLFGNWDTGDSGQDKIRLIQSGVSICKRSSDQIIIIREHEVTNYKTLTIFFLFQSSSVYLAHVKIVKNIYTFSDYPVLLKMRLIYHLKNYIFSITKSSYIKAEDFY